MNFSKGIAQLMCTSIFVDLGQSFGESKDFL